MDAITATTHNHRTAGLINANVGKIFNNLCALGFSPNARDSHGRSFLQIIMNNTQWRSFLGGVDLKQFNQRVLAEAACCAIEPLLPPPIFQRPAQPAVPYVLLQLTHHVSDTWRTETEQIIP